MDWHLVGGRASLLARLDRIISTVLALAFLITGFQTGYRLTHGEGPALSPIEWSWGRKPASGGAAPLSTPLPVRQPLPMWSGSERLNLLLMGLDQRPGSASPARADVIMIASLEPTQRKLRLLSIPRDLWVEIPGHGENRINSAYFYGELDGASDGGPGLMQRTIEQNFGLTVDYYGTINFECFERIVDILGGITVDVPEEIHDDRYPDDSYGYTEIHIPAGVQHMGGETALQYVRARHESNDFSRMRRQQQVILALREKALRLDAVLTLPELIPILGEAFSTDLPLDSLLGLANLAAQIELKDVELRVVDESLTVPYVAPDGAQVLLPRLKQIRALVSQLFDDAAVVAESSGPNLAEIRVVVRADVMRPELDTEMASLLQRRGFTACAETSGVQIESAGTFIASRREAAEAALLLAGLLEVSPEFVMLDSDVAEDRDIVLTLGRDFVIPN